MVRSGAAHLCDGPFMMPVAGDRHQVRPVSRRHDHSGDLGAGHVEGGGALVLRALDAGAAVLVGRLVVAENALLQQTNGTRELKKLCLLLDFGAMVAKHATGVTAELNRPQP